MQEAKLPSILKQFADNVTVIKTKVKGGRMFNVPAKTIGLLHYEQCRSYLFKVTGTGYVAEVFTTQKIEIKPHPTKPMTQPKPREERWGVRVFHDEWAAKFAENEQLGFCKKTKWEPLEREFFPCQGFMGVEDTRTWEFENSSGFEELMRVLRLVEGVIVGS